MGPEEFAQTLIEDYNLPMNYHGTIVKSIQDQLSDYRAHSSKYDGDTWDIVGKEKDTIGAGKLDEESAAFWENWRNRLRNDRAERVKARKRRKIAQEDDIEPPKSLEDIPVNMKTLRDDTRIAIRVRVPAIFCDRC